MGPEAQEHRHFLDIISYEQLASHGGTNMTLAISRDPLKVFGAIMQTPPWSISIDAVVKD